MIFSLCLVCVCDGLLVYQCSNWHGDGRTCAGVVASLGFLTLRSVLESTRPTVLSFGKDAELVDVLFWRSRVGVVMFFCGVCVFFCASANLPFDEAWRWFGEICFFEVPDFVFPRRRNELQPCLIVLQVVGFCWSSTERQFSNMFQSFWMFCFVETI